MPAVRPAPAVTTLHEVLVERWFGPVSVSRQRIVSLCRADRITDRGALRDMVILYLPDDVAADVRIGEARHRCRPGEGVLFDLNKRWTIAGGDAGVDCHALLMPRVFLGYAAPERAAAGIVAGNPGVEGLRLLCRSLLALAAPVSDREELLMVGAVQDMLSAALIAPAATDLPTLVRENLLLDRATAHVDARLGEELTVAGLCGALACSRSALYRATAPVGGIAELIARRRLIAAYRRLDDPLETRSIGALARLCGFRDAAQFSRRFRATFGITARQLRDARQRDPHRPLPLAQARLEKAGPV